MPKNFDDYVRNLQKEIIQKEINDHNEKIVDLCYNPQNWGKPSKEDITIFEEKRGGKKGYFLGLYLKIENDIISKANFITDGCGVMIAIASQLTIIIKGKSIDYAMNLKPDHLINALKGIPPDEIHCVNLAIITLKDVIKKYKDIK